MLKFQAAKLAVEETTWLKAAKLALQETTCFQQLHGML